MCALPFQTSIQQELEDTMQEREGEITALLQEVDDLKKRLADKEEELNKEKDEGGTDKKVRVLLIHIDT